ncbi:MAG: Bax protein [Patescibacteria group bacterium]|nr:Bax protein [Patescibacteria group bacterium]
MDSCRCCRWIRTVALSAFVASCALPVSAQESAYDLVSAKNPVETFVAWFGPKLRAVLEESTGIIADRLPIKLAMAQAALETGWGKSQAAVKRKNFFGLMKSDGTPMSFGSAEDSIRFYVKTLSEHKAYAGLRKRLGKTDSPEMLVHELRAYSEHPDYPNMLKSIIRSEKLARLDIPDESEIPQGAYRAPSGKSENDRIEARSISSDCENLELRVGRHISL